VIFITSNFRLPRLILIVSNIFNSFHIQYVGAEDPKGLHNDTRQKEINLISSLPD